MHLAQRCDHGEGDVLSGFRIFRGDILDGQREARRVGIDLDRMTVALDLWVRPDIDHGFVRPDAGERKRMEINDYGIGFDKNNKTKSGSYGLIGIKERALLLDGELTITSALNKGTALEIKLPFKQAKKE